MIIKLKAWVHIIVVLVIYLSAHYYMQVIETSKLALCQCFGQSANILRANLGKLQLIAETPTQHIRHFAAILPRFLLNCFLYCFWSFLSKIH